MAEPFGDQDKSLGGGAKCPAPIIEGTATEVGPSSGEARRADAKQRGAAGEPRAYLGDDGSEREAPKAKPAPPQTSGAELRGFVTHLAAGLLGGLVGVVALALAWNKLPMGADAGSGPNRAALERRLDRLEAAAPVPGKAEALGSLDERIKALEGARAQAPQDLSGLTDRVARLEASLKTLGETAQTGGSVADAAAVENRISEAEQRLQTKIDAALDEREAANAAAFQSIQDEIASLKAKIGTMAEAAPDSGNPDLNSELTGLDDRIAKLEAALPNLSGVLDKQAAQSKSAALAIAFANLRAAVTGGRPYAGELATIGSLAPQLGDLGPLPAHADRGIPTVPELIRAFQTAKDEALAAAPEPADETFFGSVMASAKSLVKIRRVDAPATGDKPGAILARAEAHLKQGDVDDAVKEVEALQPREAYASWLDQARARASADDTLSRLEGTLLVSMGGAAAPAQP
jgi:hypothetical protein